jgi:hypothetical protein
MGAALNNEFITFIGLKQSRLILFLDNGVTVKLLKLTGEGGLGVLL